MDWPLADIIDSISILKLKIERIGNTELQDEFNSLQKSLNEFKDQGIEIKEGWLNELYEINGKIWDLEWDVRKIVNSKDVWKDAEKKIGFEELGRRALLVENLMKKRVAVKNEIIEETGSGFKEIKIDHCGEVNVI